MPRHLLGALNDASDVFWNRRRRHKRPLASLLPAGQPGEIGSKYASRRFRSLRRLCRSPVLGIGLVETVQHRLGGDRLSGTMKLPRGGVQQAGIVLGVVFVVLLSSLGLSKSPG